MMRHKSNKKVGLHPPKIKKGTISKGKESSKPAFFRGYDVLVFGGVRTRMSEGASLNLYDSRGHCQPIP